MNTLESIIELEKQYHVGVYKRLPVCFVKGKGTRLWDTEGKEYLDFVAGLGVLNIGHSHPRFVEAIKKQVESLTHVSNLFYTTNQLELARDLSTLFDQGKCFFANSGTEANEGAIKLARKYARLNLTGDRFEVITALRSFHGRTLAMVAATGQPEKQNPYRPLPPGFIHVPLNDFSALEKAITERTCAIMLEPIQGEGGVYPCSKEYLKSVREICNEREILLILDEVQTGIGRTGKMFAYEHYGIGPDIITLAKGLGSGFPIGAIVAKDRVAQAFKHSDHASTFGGGPLATAAATMTLKILREEKLVEKAFEVGAYFKSTLEEWAQKNSTIKEVRGMGLMLGLELTREVAKDIVLNCLKKGLVINGIGQTILRFLPPLSVTEQEVDQAVAILEEVLSTIK